MHQDKLPRGLVVVGVTDEPEEDVKAFVAKHSVGYPIAIADTPGYDVTGIPHAFLIDPAGRIVWTGHPALLGEDMLQKALTDARRADGLVESLQSVQQELEAERFGGAWKTATDLLAGGKLDEEATGQAREVVARLEREVAEHLERAKTLGDSDDWFDAHAILQRIASAYAGVPRADEASQRLVGMQADRLIKKEIEAGGRMAEARRLDQDRDYEKALKAYKSIAGSFASTKAGKAAAARAREIEKGGLLGYMKGCGACEAVGKACPRHKKK